MQELRLQGPGLDLQVGLEDISLVISDLVDKSERGSCPGRFQGCSLTSRTGSLSGVQRVLSKSLKRLDGRISKPSLKLLKAQVETKLDKDIRWAPVHDSSDIGAREARRSPERTRT